MANIVITNNKTRSVYTWEPKFQDAVAVFAAAETWPAGSVLGKVTASGKYARFNPALATGVEIPIAILTADLTADAIGDLAFRPMISGECRQGDLLNSAGGAITDVQADMLRDYSIIAVKSTQRAQLDNQ